VLKLLSLTSVLNEKSPYVCLDDSMANVFVYGIAMAADILANCRKHLRNLFSVSCTVLHQ